MPLVAILRLSEVLTLDLSPVGTWFAGHLPLLAWRMAGSEAVCAGCGGLYLVGLAYMVGHLAIFVPLLLRIVRKNPQLPPAPTTSMVLILILSLSVAFIPAPQPGRNLRFDGILAGYPHLVFVTLLAPYVSAALCLFLHRTWPGKASG